MPLLWNSANVTSQVADQVENSKNVHKLNHKKGDKNASIHVTWENVLVSAIRKETNEGGDPRKWHGDPLLERNRPPTLSITLII